MSGQTSPEHVIGMSYHPPPQTPPGSTVESSCRGKKVDSTAKTQGNDTCFYPFTPSLTRFWRNESSLLPPVLLPFQQNLFSSTFTLVLIIQHLVITFESVGEILWCYHSNETSLAELLHGAIHFLGFCKKWLCNFCEFYTLSTSRFKRGIAVAFASLAHCGFSLSCH